MQNSNWESTQQNSIDPPFPPILNEQQVESWQRTHSFKFYGNASEYFGIWIVNILLMIVTIGLYAPWAKVRRLRYFYGNTEFIQRRFDFTGIPRKILIGRLIALGLYVGIGIVSEYSWQASLVAFFIFYLAVPWLVRATLRFKARNSKFGNSRFYFAGTNKEAYFIFLKCILITIFTLGLFFPVLVWLFKRYSLDHLYVGQLKFKLRADWSAYMGAMYVPIFAFICVLAIAAMLMTIFDGLVSSLGASAIILLISAIYITALVFIWPLMMARLFITTWNNTEVGQSQFQTSCNQWHYAWIVVSNWIVTILSIGLMTPWAAIRLYKYQTASLFLELKNDPDTMFSQLQQDPSAIAEEISDIFDLDISL